VQSCQGRQPTWIDPGQIPIREYLCQIYLYARAKGQVGDRDPRSHEFSIQLPRLCPLRAQRLPSVQEIRCICDKLLPDEVSVSFLEMIAV